MDLSVFIDSWMVLRCKFVTKIMLIIHQYFSHCWTVFYTVKAFSVSHSPSLPANKLWVFKGLGGDIAGTAVPRHIQYHIISHVLKFQIKAQLGMRQWIFWSAAIAWKLAGHWSTGRRWQVITYASLLFGFSVILHFYSLGCFYLSEFSSRLSFLFYPLYIWLWEWWASKCVGA